MMFNKSGQTLNPFILLAVVLLSITIACSPVEHKAPPGTPEAPVTEPTPANGWLAVLQRTPYPFATPLPPADPTILDGTYTKLDPRPGKRAPCRRCPPYPPEGGVWRLNLDEGIFRVYHDGTDWHTLGSFAVSGDRIEFFNDPHCYQDTGIYTWELESGKLTLELVQDECGINLRAKNFMALPWESCQPPSTEAAITDHWPTPIGCGLPEITPNE
jgi:hypothetical protein